MFRVMLGHADFNACAFAQLAAYQHDAYASKSKAQTGTLSTR